MKRAIIIFIAALVLVTISCVEEYTVIVNNDSSQTVIYTLTTGYRTENYTINSKQQNYHSLVKALYHTMAGYSAPPLEDSIDLVQSGDVYTFSEIKPIPIEIFNTLSKDVELSGDGAIIDNDPLIILAYQELLTESVRSRKPEFTAKILDVNGNIIENFPVDVHFISGEEKFTVYLK